MRGSYTGRNRGLHKRKRSSDSAQVVSLFLAIATVLVMLWSIAGPYGFWKLQRMKQHRALLVAQVGDLSMKNTRLKKQIEAFSSDITVQEELVRKKLGWIRKDELLYKFIGTGRSRR